MPKHEAGSAKALANRMKAAGLQRLRWYCQMCQKQCRDENGFKCHTTSEGHLRQMRLFAENPNRIMDEFSREFEQGYLQTLSHRHSTKRVKANAVYQEYIADKHHIHMNATIWTSLTEFILYLGREGKAVVDETEKGWFIQYVDRDPKVLAKQALAAKRQRVEVDEEERKKREIQLQIEHAAANAADNDADEVDNSLKREEGMEKVALTAPTAIGKKRPRTKIVSAFASVDDEDEEDDQNHKNKGSVMEQLIREDEQRRQVQSPAISNKDDGKDSGIRKDYWMKCGIIVKIISKRLLHGRVYKEKAEVIRLRGKYEAEVELLSDGKRITVQQEDVETVVPKVGQALLIVNGDGRGYEGIMLRIHEEKYNCDIRIHDETAGKRNGEEMYSIEYEDICKLMK